MSLTKVTYSMISGASVNVLDFGATGDGVTNDASAIQAAIDSLSATGGTVFLPVGNYLVGATILMPNKNTCLVGESSSGEGITLNGATVITASHTSGAVVRVQNLGCQLSNLVINSTDARYAAASGTNYGLLIEALDASNELVTKTYINSIRVTRQPHHGIVIIGRNESSVYLNVFVDNVDGHGFMLDDGSETSRTNKSRPGQINLINCSASRTGGHSLKIGDMSSIDNRPYRIIVSNFEAFFNLQDKVTYTNGYNVYLFGENSEFRGSAFGGTVSDSASTHGGLFIAGRNNIISNHRFVDCEPYCAYVDDFGGSIFNTIGILFEYLFINNQNQPAGYYNPAIFVEVTCQDVRAIGTSNPSGDIAALMFPRGAYYSIEFEGLKRYNGIYASSFRSTAGGSTLDNNKAGFYEFNDVNFGVAVISSSTTAGGQALVSFRCGDANAFCTVLSSGGATVVGTTGQLTGTTGTPSNFTVAADTATNRLYIENRTGAIKAYHITFLSSVAIFEEYVAV
jgi:hypothetical protein